jgi:Domain of unknown function (DUF4835)
MKHFIPTFFIVFGIFYGFGTAQAQEFKCTILLNDSRVQTQERQILNQMKNDLTAFMNNTRFSRETYEEHEKIKCTILINLGSGSDVSQGKYEATVQIQSLRPVYGTEYETPVLNFFDQQFTFDYQPSQPLIFTENVYTSNLTSMMAFYAYAMLGLDYDSFAVQSGTPFLERMLNIVNNSQQNGGGGWSNKDTRNRYWLSENLSSPQFVPFREAVYVYHRLIIDDLANETEAKRTKIVELLQKIKQVQDLKPNSVLINAFFDAKSAELINIFSQGDPKTVQEAVDLMVRLDPTNAASYKKLLNQ